MVGSKSSSGIGYGQLKAAKNWTTLVEKTIDCVDNVSIDTTEVDLSKFITGLGITVVSGFLVKKPAICRKGSVFIQSSAIRHSGYA